MKIYIGIQLKFRCSLQLIRYSINFRHPDFKGESDVWKYKNSVLYKYKKIVLYIMIFSWGSFLFFIFLEKFHFWGSPIYHQKFQSMGVNVLWGKNVRWKIMNGIVESTPVLRTKRSFFENKAYLIKVGSDELWQNLVIIL